MSYQPPPGPPPGYRPQEQYAPPPGPPPGHAAREEQYAPPPGPPPGRANDAPPSYEAYAPPSGPPPNQHNWQEAVPDTSLLPPPPSVGYDASANNATEADANRGELWCRQRPLYQPRPAPPGVFQDLANGNIGLVRPAEYVGDLKNVGIGHWHGKTKSRNHDNCLISNIPLYVVDEHSPLRSKSSKTIYFEVRISRRNRSEVSLGIGFVAQPYPTFRLPGWERASLGVHGDDGHKYVNDHWGGHDFTSGFKPGETLGIGMTFSRRDIQAASSSGPRETTSQKPINVEVFFTRDGRRAGGWNLHEELDADQDLPVTGLEGDYDLFAAIGSFEDVDFEVLFAERDWLYKGYPSSV